MSRAFVKESAPGLEALPERSISEFPNFVTPAGLAQIDARITSLRADHDAAQERDDESALARIARDLRYWSQRQATARLMQPLAAPDSVQFGVQVTLKFADCALQTLRLVGEDEADPISGRISWAAPLGRALIGARIGDPVQLLETQAEVIALET
jgi:transcription elongation GreA/GreB family factor